MSDIVEYLRQQGAICDCDIVLEAVNEIERLRSLLRNCHNILKNANYVYARDVGKVIETWK